MAQDKMRAVVYKGPYKVVLDDRPIPRIQDQTDIIVKVMYTALCGRYAQCSSVMEGVRVPFADATVMKAPEAISDNVLVLMADIFPTGYFAASNAVKELTKEQLAEATVNLLAVDAVQSRLDLAKSLGAEPWNFQTNREGLDKRVQELTDGRGADVVIGKVPNGSKFRIFSADGVYAEVVGLSPALKLGFELLRPWVIFEAQK
ncbi:MAG: hypothetical protein Q9191_002320 [Dirinaria sp. TL-2023a]